jgi:hypothetical protein
VMMPVLIDTIENASANDVYLDIVRCSFGV